jgi:hypothetical protein
MAWVSATILGQGPQLKYRATRRGCDPGLLAALSHVSGSILML